MDELKMNEVLMGGSFTNWKFENLLLVYRADQDLPRLTNIVSCSLHILQGVFKSGAEIIDSKIKEILKGAFQLLHDTPA